MRQPASIYVRSARRNVSSLIGRIGRRSQRLFSPDSVTKGNDSQRRPRSLVKADELKSALDSLGLAHGDTVLVHSGISNLGKVTGGPRGVFDLIRAQVGSDGTVLYPVFPFGTLMATYLATNPVFDVRTAASKMGALTDYALTVPEGRRSVHPTHSVMAFGARSAQFVDQHHLCSTPFGDASPFGRLVEAKGKILLLGVGLNSTTSFHRTEDRMGGQFPVTVYLQEEFRITCFDADGVKLEVLTRAHDPFVSRIRDCDLVRTEFIREGVLREVVVGDGVIGIIDALAMDDLLEDLWRTRRKTIYGRLWG